MGCGSSQTASVSQGRLECTHDDIVQESTERKRPNKVGDDRKQVDEVGHVRKQQGGDNRDEKRVNESDNNNAVLQKDVDVEKKQLSAKPPLANEKFSVKELDSSKYQKDEPNKYGQIDRHAKTAPENLRNSSEDLVEYMKRFTDDEELLVRGFYAWITENISYDVGSFFGRGTLRSKSAIEVMRDGTGVCDGYSNVMQELCKIAGIGVKKINGYAKGYGHDPTKPITTDDKTNHAWNAVCIQGQWCLLDCTWGSGFVGADRKFHKRYQEHYFFTPPDQFITSHFPYMGSDMEESMKWQLLKTPVSIETYSKMVKIDPDCFKLGVTPVSHTDSLIKVSNEVKIAFRSVGKDALEYLSSLNYIENPTATFGGQEQERATLTEVQNEVCHVTVHPRKVGWYRLSVFAKQASPTSEYKYLLAYTILCEKVKDPNFEFIQRLNKEGVPRVMPESHQSGRIDMADEIEITLSCNEEGVHYLASLDCLLPGGTDKQKQANATLIRTENGRCHIAVHPRKVGNYELNVFAKSANDEGSYHFILKYRLHCSQVKQPDFEFPVQYGSGYTSRCVPLNPRNAILPHDASMTFEIVAPLMDNIRVGNMPLQSDESGTFRGWVETGESGSKLTVYGRCKGEQRLQGLFQYRVEEHGSAPKNNRARQRN